MILESHTIWFTLSESENPPNPLMDINTQQHRRNCELVFVSWVIADLWTHYPELLLAILLSFLPWTGTPQRCLDQSSLVCGHLLPPLLIVRHLMFFRFHLHVIRGLGSHTHIQTQVTQAHTCTHTCARHKDTNREEMFQYMKDQWFIQKYSDFVFLIGKSPFWSSNVNSTEVQLPRKSVQA